jgi:hypothetical protein
VPDRPALIAFDDFDGFHGARSRNGTQTQTRPRPDRSVSISGGETPAQASVGGGMAWAGVNPGRC